MLIFKKLLSIFLRISVSVILLIFLFKQVDAEAILFTIKNAKKMLLILSFFIFFSTYILCFFRWEMLLKAIRIHLPLKRIIISFSGGTFFNLFLPSTIGGDLVRSIDLASYTKRPREVVATVLLDRLSGYVALVSLALLAFLLGGSVVKDKVVLTSLAIITAVLIVILLALFNQFIYLKINQLLQNFFGFKKIRKLSTLVKIRDQLRNLHREMHYFRNHKKVILQNLGLSLLIQGITPVIFYMIALSLGIRINLIYFFLFLPIISAITLLPISIGGLGLRDATTILFFSKVGLQKDLSFAMSLLAFFFILIYGIIGGLIYVITVHYRRVQPDKSFTV